MSWIKANKVRLSELKSISEKAYIAKDFSGNKDVLPKSQVLKEEFDGKDGCTIWVASWILSKKSIEYSNKTALFNERGDKRPINNVVVHNPTKIEPTKFNDIQELKR